LELVRSVDGIEYFNDSFGTTPETAIAAIEAFESQEILILGGQPKNVSFDNLGKAIKQNENRVAKVLIIGEASNLLESALKSNGYKSYVLSDATTMPEIVKQASSLAGEVKQMSGSKVVVLLSTANTSFDMFKNYKDRGAQFKKAVSELI
jgi:UDP-N-acetylmuramoylalanine--D-glutamate ligase